MELLGHRNDGPVSRIGFRQSGFSNVSYKETKIGLAILFCWRYKDKMIHASIFKRLIILLILLIVSAVFLPGCEKKPDSVMTPPCVHLTVAGDTALLMKALRKANVSKQDYVDMLSSMIPKKDLFAINLEAPITDHDQLRYPDKKYNYKQEKEVLSFYKALGVTHCCMANNHVLDYDVKGMNDTLAQLDKHGLPFFGAGKTLKKTRKGTIVEVEGVKIGFTAFMIPYWIYEEDENYFVHDDSPGVLEMTGSNVRKSLSYLKDRADVVVVFAHWGENYEDVKKEQREWSHRLVEEGADLVIGHNPHIPQTIEYYKGVPVFYSVGNFLFSTLGRFKEKVDRELHYGWVLDVQLNGAEIQTIDIFPLYVDNLKIDFLPRQITKRRTQAHFDYIVKDRPKGFTIHEKYARWTLSQ